MMNIEENMQFVKNPTLGIWQTMIAQHQNMFCKILMWLSVILLSESAYTQPSSFWGVIRNIFLTWMFMHIIKA